MEIVLRRAAHAAGMDLHSQSLRVLRSREVNAPERCGDRGEREAGRERQQHARELRHVHLRAPGSFASCACAFLLTFAMGVTLETAGDTRMSLSISWWSAEQKSVQ